MVCSISLYDGMQTLRITGPLWGEAQINGELRRHDTQAMLL